MKKLLAIGLVFVLVLSMSLVAFGNTDVSEVVVGKEITLGNEGTLNPAEEFNFNVGVGLYNGPIANVTAPVLPATLSISIAQGVLVGSGGIDLPAFTAIGEYTYPVNEVAGNTAGFVYDSATYYLKITVLNDGEGGFIRVLTLLDEENDVKADAFDNKFNAGSLVITKQITGNFAVFTDEFDVTVTLTPDQGKNIKEGPISVTGAVNDVGSVSKNAETGIVTVTFKVTHNSTVTIANIPYDVTYEVTEDEGEGEYTATITDNDNGRIDGASQTVGIVNDLSTEINTGINLDNLPYILILGAASIGLFGFTIRRRISNNK